MRTVVEFDWQPYRYFPYEKRLAVREIATLLGFEPHRESGTSLVVNLSSEPPPEVLERLTYFRETRINGHVRVPSLQGRLEASARPKRLAKVGETLAVTRQATRYSAHCLHEYRGRFHPQIVRAIANVLGLRKGCWVLDPFCGGGTTLLECAHMALNAEGVDINPLGVLIARAKLGALRVHTDLLSHHTQELCSRLRARVAGLDFDRAFSRNQLGRLSSEDDLPNMGYLRRWFTRSVLVQLATALDEIDRSAAEIRDIARVILSDGLREVSLQDPADLRIRRRRESRENYPAIPTFIAALQTRMRTILSAREIVGEGAGLQVASGGDSRFGLPQPPGGLMFDCVITSPPYATALPYVDTQRFSLALLDLVPGSSLRDLDGALIGSREISRTARLEEERLLEGAGVSLPKEIATLCKRCLRLVRSGSDGFRRKNVPALLLRYFRDMGSVFHESLKAVRRGGYFAFVVGPNRSSLGGRNIRIDTPRLLAAVAAAHGWHVEEIIPLDAYQRFDLHRANSIRSECLVLLRR